VGQQEYRDAGRKLLSQVMADADVAGAILLLTTQPDMDDVARTVVEVGTACGKPLLFINAGGKAGEGARAVMREAGYPSFDHPLDAVRVMASLVQDFRLATPVAPPPAERLALGGVLAELPAGLLNENDAKRLLAAAGVPVTRGRLARSADEAVRIAAELGYPVVLKAQAAEATHKSDIGGVQLDLKSQDEVRAAFRAIAERAKTLGFQGCLVQEMVKADVELIVGSRWDEQFGAVLLVGIGGTLVELLQDVRLAPAPLSAQRAAELLRSLKLAPLLSGYRGRPAVDLDKVGATIARISQLAAELGPRLVELDVNPLLVSGARVLAADARALLAPPR
jgi:acetyl-CoA synthetase (ADP-forming)